MKAEKLPLGKITLKQLLLSFFWVIALASFLAYSSNSFVSLQGWPSYSFVLLVALLILKLAWQLIQPDNPPAWLWGLMIVAVILRLALGVFWTLALPVWGYDTPVQNAGYIMADAYDRDNAAWRLAQSEEPLASAFQGYSASDQYGGLLYLSSLIYRYIGVALHQPLLIIVLTAAFSSVSLLFVWAMANRLWAEKTAKFAAWSLALYPEAIMLGGSQMREAFMVSLSVVAVYALIRFWNSRDWRLISGIGVSLVLSYLLSIPFSILLFGVLIIFAAALDNWRILKNKLIWVVIIVVGLAIIIANAIDLIAIDKLWPIQAIRWQSFYSQSASGWVQRTFERFPAGMDWLQIPFLVAYGIFRPLLPAALFDGIPLMRVLAIWRAIGWTVMLILLLYTSFLLLKTKQRPKLASTIMALVWGLIMIASLRGGGDQWDNPRYRSTFAGFQIMLASWAIVKQRELKDPWLKRALVATGLMVAWFIPWYLRRYSAFEWPVVALSITIGLGLVSGALYLIWDWVGVQQTR